MKRGFLVIAIITIALVVGLATVRFSPWLRTQGFGAQYCDGPNTELIPCPRSFPPQQTGPGKCADTLDNDDDTLIDRNDPDCYDTAFFVSKNTVYVPTNQETIKQGECVDTLDNDADGLIDGADPACQKAVDASQGPGLLPKESDNVSECEDDQDNDNDGRQNQQDAGCHQDKNPLLGYLATNTEDGEGVCADGKDNDDNGVSDADDLGCYDIANLRGTELVAGVDSVEAFSLLVTGDVQRYRPNQPTEKGEPECVNGKDDDGDGNTDDGVGYGGSGSDPGCGIIFDPFENEAGDEGCDDGNDNDRDGLTDAQDPGCHNGGHISGKFDATRKETQHKQCSDGVDNEKNAADTAVGDGNIDAADTGCYFSNNPQWRYSARDNNEAGERQCVDGRDNDGDDHTDETDPHCYLGGKIRSSTRWLWLDNKEAPVD